MKSAVCDPELEAERALRRGRRAARVAAIAALTPPHDDPKAYDEDSSLCLDALRCARDILDAAIGDRTCANALTLDELVTLKRDLDVKIAAYKDARRQEWRARHAAYDADLDAALGVDHQTLAHGTIVAAKQFPNEPGYGRTVQVTKLLEHGAATMVLTMGIVGNDTVVEDLRPEFVERFREMLLAQLAEQGEAERALRQQLWPSAW